MDFFTIYIFVAVVTSAALGIHALYHLKGTKINWPRFVAVSVIYAAAWVLVVLYVICHTITKILDKLSDFVAKLLTRLFGR